MRWGVGWWMGVGFCVSALLSAGALAAFGAGERGLDAALMLTGRWGFLLFWPAYAGSGVVAVCEGKAFFFAKKKQKTFGRAIADSSGDGATAEQKFFGSFLQKRTSFLAFLQRHGREFGLAFAAAMLVHVILIGWLCVIGAAPGMGVFVFFGPALAGIYTLALFSLRGLRRRLGQRSWWVLRTVAMNYIAYAFAHDFVPNGFGGGLKHFVLYAPFASLSVLGFLAYGSGQVMSARRKLIAA
jgi:hypothetical protein